MSDSSLTNIYESLIKTGFIDKMPNIPDVRDNLNTIVGQELLSKKVNSSTAQVDISNFANGSYFIQVTTETAMKTVRVIKR